MKQYLIKHKDGSYLNKLFSNRELAEKFKTKDDAIMVYDGDIPVSVISILEQTDLIRKSKNVWD